VFDYHLALVVGLGVSQLGVDVSAEEVDRGQFVAADAAVVDLWSARLPRVTSGVSSLH
jgi:hypothetical protein